ncbi:MAG: hypothetical protein GY720_17460 [bacterium]|nr:hypothetical protein [bacterium]
MTAVRTEAAYAASESDDAPEAELWLGWFHVDGPPMAASLIWSVRR